MSLSKKLLPKDEWLSFSDEEKWFQNCEFYNSFKEIINQNFVSVPFGQRPKTFNISAFDQTGKRYLLTQFTSKIASPDNEQLLEELADDTLINQIKKEDPTKINTAKLRRGIRTLKEIAHFIRSW